MSIIHRNRAIALGFAGALALGFAVSAGPVLAAPVATNTAALKQVDVGNVVDVQWRRRGYRSDPGPWVAGAALGIIGGAIASSAYQDRYYGGYDSYGYGSAYPGGYYGGYAPYGYAPYRGNAYPPYGSCDNGAVC